jgi:hypothetical protein
MQSKLLEFSFLPRTFIYFFIGFFVSTIVGTISHEYGHIFVAKYFGFTTSLHYGSMNYKDTSVEYRKIEILMAKNEQEIINKRNFKDKNKLHSLWKIKNYRDFLITLGGPMQTMLVGTFGFLYLIIMRKKIRFQGMKFIDWVVVFLSLFWMREICNLAVGIFGKLFFGFQNFFGGDEKNLAIYFDLPRGTFSIILGLFGLLISVIVIFKIIPKNYRFTFICAGFFGGIFSYFFWLIWVGPILMP